MNDRSCSSQRLYRSDHGLFFGVCGGIAEHFDLPVWAVRLLYLLLSVPFLPFMVVLYIVLGLTLKKRPLTFGGTGLGEGMWAECGGSRAEALRLLKQRFEALDKRLQRMESIVTRPGFGLEDEYRNL
jgi:phage shock protein C